MHFSHRTLALAAALAFSSLAHAQTAASAPAAAVSPDKQKLIDKLLTVWHPENGAAMLVQRPAGEVMENSSQVLQRAGVSREVYEKTMKDIQVDAQKYVDTATPLAVASAKKTLSTAIVPLLAQTFSNDELRQLIAMFESPVKAKFEKIAPQMDRAIGERVTAEAGPAIKKDIGTMTQSVSAKLRAVASAPAASSTAH